MAAVNDQIVPSGRRQTGRQDPSPHCVSLVLTPARVIFSTLPPLVLLEDDLAPSFASFQFIPSTLHPPPSVDGSFSFIFGMFFSEENQQKLKEYSLQLLINLFPTFCSQRALRVRFKLLNGIVELWLMFPMQLWRAVGLVYYVASHFDTLTDEQIVDRRLELHCGIYYSLLVFLLCATGISASSKKSLSSSVAYVVCSLRCPV